MPSMGSCPKCSKGEMQTVEAEFFMLRCTNCDFEDF